MQRNKGARLEREIVKLHRELRLRAERVPLSGASRYQGNGADVDVYPFGESDAPLCCEVKGRKRGAGFTTLERWLGDNDALFLRRNNADHVVVLPWRTWARLLRGISGKVKAYAIGSAQARTVRPTRRSLPKNFLHRELERESAGIDGFGGDAGQPASPPRRNARRTSPTLRG